MSNKEILECVVCSSALKRPRKSGRCIKCLTLGRRDPVRRGTDKGSSLHRWIRRRKPEPDSCEKCGGVAKLDLANKSQGYWASIDDWLYLCRPCHRVYDMRKPFCKNGHEYTSETEVWRKDGSRTCRLCAREAYRRWKIKKS